jgi:7-cyano-7-deazaguanine synthase in queuosine biosynthesis
MRLVCGPSGIDFQGLRGDVDVVLFGRGNSERGSAGAAVVETLQRQKLLPEPRAWDFLSIALGVTAADLAGHRSLSGDGWTREFQLVIAVADPDFWATQAAPLQDLLQFLTTDRWNITFVPGASYPAQPAKPNRPDHDSIVLFSGGLDSFTGALGLVAEGRRPFAVSQAVRGDAEKQRGLAVVVRDTIGHLQLNHNVAVPAPENPPSQRGRSIIFFAYGILAASTLRYYADGNTVDLFVCENGFIALNPPLTGSRLGSLSTRTCHPVVLALLQQVMQAAGLRVRVQNPFASYTKGEVLAQCLRQPELRAHAHTTTSCGRFKRFGYRHCGRCVPCLIRRAAFNAWGVPDQTLYVHADLAIDDLDHARSDDVRATAMAIAEVEDLGLDKWLGVALSSPLIGDSAPMYRTVAEKGLQELESLLATFGVK